MTRPSLTANMPPNQIVRVIARYCEDQEIAPSRFGRDAINDPRLLSDLRAGRRPRPRLIQRINAALAAEIER